LDKKQTIVIDIDDTICFTNHNYQDAKQKYGNALPNNKIINGMRILKRQGFHIILLTARRMLTHNGDIEKIIEDVGKITTDWLERYDVPYDELIWGKPYSSTYYVDDKAMNLEEFVKWTKIMDSI
jgi:capsule biosynthesis phosphatase|tara:strand:+ start:2007 stop:2381 length:375 start_codon:yes stop_codon:yes gene_type:complete